MKLQDLTLQQLQEIVDGAPEGAEYYDPSINGYLRCAGFDAIKLSDIRAELKARPKFKVGDLVVLNTGRKIYRVDHIYRTVVWLDSGKESCDVVDIRDVLRHATPEEEAAGHRIDEPASSCGMTALEIDQFGEDLRNKPYVDLPEFEQADTITAKLDPAKCRVVDPAVYDAPTDSPRNDFDAMSESHRSPSCKCHEFPFDAELKVPAGLKHDQGKPRYSLIPSSALASIVDVLEYGATKYAPDGWKHVENARERYYNASMRHIQSWWHGEKLDDETGLPHLAHAACCLMFLLWLDEEQG